MLLAALIVTLLLGPSRGEIGDFLGSFKTHTNGVSGKIFLAKDVSTNRLFVTEFHYDGKGGEAFFYVGKKGLPSKSGVVLYYPTANRDPLPVIKDLYFRNGMKPITVFLFQEYQNASLELTVWPSVNVLSMKWIALIDVKRDKSLGDMVVFFDSEEEEVIYNGSSLSGAFNMMGILISFAILAF